MSDEIIKISDVLNDKEEEQYHANGCIHVVINEGRFCSHDRVNFYPWCGRHNKMFEKGGGESWQGYVFIDEFELADKISWGLAGMYGNTKLLKWIQQEGLKHGVDFAEMTREAIKKWPEDWPNFIPPDVYKVILETPDLPRESHTMFFDADLIRKAFEKYDRDFIKRIYLKIDMGEEE